MRGREAQSARNKEGRVCEREGDMRTLWCDDSTAQRELMY